jgi:glycerol kinase
MNCKQQWQRQQTFQPGMDKKKVAELQRGWRKAVDRAKGWLKD